MRYLRHDTEIIGTICIYDTVKVTKNFGLLLENEGRENHLGTREETSETSWFTII